MQVNASTYFEYFQLDSGKVNSYLRENQDQILTDFRETQMIHLRLNSFMYLVDYTTSEFVFLEDSCQAMLGYPIKYFRDTGHKGYYSKLHPSDDKIIQNKLFGEIFKLLKTLSPERYKYFINSMNYRYRTGNEGYVELLQRHSYIPGDSLGNPIGAVGIVYDITHFKDEDGIIHTIEELVPSGEGLVPKLVHKKIYPQTGYRTDSALTWKEKEILKCMADGLISKQIAVKIKISIQTVNKHRKQMLHKTGCKTASALVCFALKHGQL